MLTRRFDSQQYDWFRSLTIAALMGYAMTGCKPPEDRFDTARWTPPESIRHFEIGRSVQGRAIDVWSVGEGPDVTLILATIHGDEPAGTPLVKKLAEHLHAVPQYLDGLRVVMVPVANPDGLAARSRGNARGVDLNRNYPADNYEQNGDHGATALSEPESVALHQLIQTHRPRQIISFHQPVRRGRACIDYDGPAESLARAMASACDLPLIKLGSRPGSLGSYAGLTLGMPIITVELPAEATHWDANTLWQRYGPMLLAALRHREP